MRQRDRKERRKSPESPQHDAPLAPSQKANRVPSTGWPSLTTVEVSLLAFVFFIGATLRLLALTRSAVEHFDEGVYASNIYFPPPEFTYPQQKYYAPPLLPALIEAAMMTGLSPNLAALLPSFLAGCATIVALWWLGRSWFGPRVGLAAAALVALSPFHIAYSAAALTDVLLGLWFVLALDAAARSLLLGDLRWAVGAGLYIGLAWWTKYNGWLPLAMEAAALPVLWLVTRGPATRGKEPGDSGQEAGVSFRWLLCLVTTCAIAMAVWAPYVWSLQSEGGYAPIAANHARYVVGLAGWLNSASRQIVSFSIMEGYWTAAAIVAALLFAAIVPPSRQRAGGPEIRLHRIPLLELSLAGFAIAILVAFNAALLALAVVSLAGLAVILIRSMGNRADRGATASMGVGAALAAAWWGELFVATPCYWPYPRLLLPWLLAAWLGAAVFLEELVRCCSEDGPTPLWSSQRRRFWLLTGAVLVGLLLSLPVSQRWRPAPLVEESINDKRLAVEKIARQMRAELDRATPVDRESAPRVVYVLGEPALLFELLAAGEPVVRPAQGVVGSSAKLEGRDLPTFLVIGPQSDRDPTFADQWAIGKTHWRLVASYDYQPSAIVWLDLHDPRIAEPPPQHALRLYQFQQEASK